ncbi:hypothetical protein [Sodalis praecaptivus]|nr:hypothetical protein [Sodalis praecaptivus]
MRKSSCTMPTIRRPDKRAALRDDATCLAEMDAWESLSLSTDHDDVGG